MAKLNLNSAASKLLTPKNLIIGGGVLVALYFVNQTSTQVGNGVANGAEIAGAGAAAALILLVLI